MIIVFGFVPRLSVGKLFIAIELSSHHDWINRENNYEVNHKRICSLQQ